MSACCGTAGNRKSTRPLRRIREACAWILPGALLVSVPKCPACLAAYVALWTGLGLSLTAARYLRGTLLFVGVASLLFLAVNRLSASYFQEGTGQCHTK
jgi:hypothetical protein